MAWVLELIEDALAQLSAANWAAAAVALVVHVANVVVRTRAWHNIVAAAHAEARVSWRRIFSAYAAGAGVNAISPWRGGELLRLTLARRAVSGSTCTSLGARSSRSRVFNTFAASCMLGLVALSGAASMNHADPASLLLVFAFGATALAGAHACGLSRRLLADVATGLRVLRQPGFYFARVVPWQGLDWALRLATMYLFMRAFELGGGLGTLLLVQAAQSASGLLPLAPARLGTKQALLAYALGAQTSPATILAFVAGSELVLVGCNVALGLAAVGLLGGARLRQVPAPA